MIVANFLVATVILLFGLGGDPFFFGMFIGIRWFLKILIMLMTAIILISFWQWWESPDRRKGQKSEHSMSNIQTKSGFVTFLIILLTLLFSMVTIVELIATLAGENNYAYHHSESMTIPLVVAFFAASLWVYYDLPPLIEVDRQDDKDRAGKRRRARNRKTLNRRRKNRVRRK